MADTTAQAIIDLVNQFDQKVTALQNAINDILDWIPWGFGWVADKLKDGWNALRSKIKEVFEPLVFISSHLGDPGHLTSTGEPWSTLVGSTVSAEVGNADLGSLKVDDNWQGSAANQYRQTVPLQKTALTNIKTQFTDGISTVLKDVATAIRTFWTVMVSALAVLIGGFLTAIAACVGIITAPAAPFAALIAVGVFGAAFWGAGELLKSQCSSANSVLNQKLAENTGYPGAAWPKATV